MSTEHCKDIGCNLIIDGCPSSEPTISIVIPTYKRPTLLLMAIKSALDQKTHLSFEVVIVDNHSELTEKDVVKEVCNSFLPANLRLYRNDKNIGMFGNWNRAIHLARGQYVSILNDDDILFPDFLAEVYKLHVGPELVVAGAVVFGSDIKEPSGFSKKVRPIIKKIIYTLLLKKRNRKLRLADFLSGNPGYGSLGKLINKNAAIHVGGFDADKWPTADYHFFKKYWEMYGAITVDMGLAGYRVGVNEGLRVETIEKTIKNDIELKKEMIDSLNISKLRQFALNKILNLQVRVDVYEHYFLKNKDFNPQGFLHTLGLKTTKKAFSRYIYLLIPRLWVLCCYGVRR